MKVLVTGARGFVGKHLLDYILAKKNITVYGLISPVKNRAVALDSYKKRGASFLECDINDAAQVKRIIKKSRPDKIFHLAGKSSSSKSWDSQEDTFFTNVIGTLNIFKAVKELGFKTMIQVAGSSEQYGCAEKKYIPTDESTPLNPLSPYGVSRASQDLLAYQYFRSFGLKIIRTCAFNHAGPGQSGEFVVSSFARQVALIEAGRKSPVISAGNLEPRRDFTDVRDVVRAYWMVLEKGVPGERYNVCSGTGRKIKDILDFYVKIAAVSITIKEDPSLMRPADIPLMIGDPGKIRKKTGWKPVISFEKTLLDVLNFWRAEVRHAR